MNDAKGTVGVDESQVHLHCRKTTKNVADGGHVCYHCPCITQMWYWTQLCIVIAIQYNGLISLLITL